MGGARRAAAGAGGGRGVNGPQGRPAVAGGWGEIWRFSATQLRAAAWTGRGLEEASEHVNVNSEFR